nr:putative hydrolase or acyltransferase [uncultured archaeon GZfos37B2]
MGKVRTKEVNKHGEKIQLYRDWHAMKIENARVNTGIRIEYSLSGIENNETLIFVHGLGANLHQFELQQQFFAKDYRVLLVSLRGHGGSSTLSCPARAEYTVRKLSWDVQALLQHPGIKKVHFVGNSLGGLVGYELLELDSDLLGSLTTFGTTPVLHASGFIQWSLLTVIRLFGPKGMGWLVSKTGSKDAAVGAGIGRMYETVSKDALELITANIADYDYTGTISGHRIPMLLIRGGLDTEINKNLDTTLAVLRENPDFELVELSGAGHLANMEVPDDFNGVLGGFLSGEFIKNSL